ncbi:OstA-like protein [Pseudotenacibaculum sp. MALMAid0570]|uniref:OstA-like protein n=1 Tax=Pseudotenacibaculum sp. MALMAid0570 TaxID=3143938 RepID=UPI0032DFB461
MKKILLAIFVLSCFVGFSQQRKIKILKSELSYTDEEKHPGATILIGKVKIEHEGAILDCQKAFYYRKDNFFKAIGNVVINQGDTIRQTSDYVDYDGNAKIAISWGNVVLKDTQMTLTTDTLYFNREKQKLYYQDYATIKDETNTLNSKNGNYYLENKKFTATTKVTIDNPDNLIESNHLDYYTNSGHAYLYGPSTITGKKDGNKIESERGFYNTKTDVSHFVKNAKLYIDNRTIEGDSLYYDKPRGFASATNNIQVIDTAENFLAKGNYAEYYEKLDSIFMIKKAVAISVMEKDSMFVHGDTLLVTGKKNQRVIRTYNNVKIFKSDLQGKCDSLHTNQASGITKMYFSPVIWSGKSQITGDSIQLLSDKETDKLDSLKILGNSFIIQKDSLDPKNFNQIKGKNMYGKFIENKLRTLLVKGNGQAVNFNRNDNGVLETITKQLCSNIEFELIDNEIDQIKCLKQSDGKTYPPSKFPEVDRKLQGFLWREDEQPKTKDDIFIKDGKTVRKPLFKGTIGKKQEKKSREKKEKSNP